MGALTNLTDAEVQAIADELLEPLPSGGGIDGIVAEAGRDHDGDPAAFVRVSMPSGASIIPPRPLGDAPVAVWRAIGSRGDERLAYVSVNWPRDVAPPSPDVPT